MIYRIAIAVAAIVASVSITSYAADPLAFNRDVRPILAENCFLCHGPDAKHREGDLRLDIANEDAVEVLGAGDPTHSALVARIDTDDRDELMPPPDSGKSLTAAERNILKRWIADGAKYERHWSLISPSQPDPPQVAARARVVNAIDQFALRKLAAQNLSLAPEAQRAELIRRVTLDLTGVPPTVSEVDAFLADTSPNAWEKVVDRLLESPRYGEHLARYWLDAARYADTNGYQYDLEREQWVWRDWVIHAFNTNMPFDQFTVEQIAGDLLPNATAHQKLATGFHRNHPITIEGGVIDEEYRTEYVVDRVVTTSTVWMGLTMVCGRCHEHKYDPISQQEFYQFFAFFNQVPERGLRGFNPQLKVESPLRSAELQKIDRQLAARQRDYDRIIGETAGEVKTWALDAASSVRDQWSIVVPPIRRSAGGATLEVQPDKSILATGKNAVTETYEIELPCESPIHAIRLEALKHKSFVNGSTGRGSNGNFVLSELTIAASSTASPDKFEPVRIESAAADYSQANYHISLAIDGKIDRSGWAVDGNTKFDDRVATFRLANPLLPDTIARVRVQLHHRYGGSHHIGRLRFALARGELRDFPAAVTAALLADAGKRNETQRAALSEYLISERGSDAQRTALRQLETARRRRGEVEKTPATMVMAELPQPRTTRVLFRGEYDKPREAVTAGTPSALPPMPDDAPRNRLGLARWLTAPDHPLTSRVFVNRVWQRLFGVGIVATLEDFGSQGDWPSHPELLDWLAVDFVESGWNVKALHKRIAMSATYRQSSRVTADQYDLDPDNRLLARGPRFRLDAEVIRDSALFVSGQLVEQLGGPSVFPYHPKGLWQEINNRPGYSRVYKQDVGDKLYRRSLYTFWKRTVPPPSMSTFDAPEREFCVVRRARTNTPLQAIVMLHDPQFVEAGRALGARMLAAPGDSTDDRLTHGFRLCFARRPEPAELAVLSRILTSRLKQYRADVTAATAVLAVGARPIPSDADRAELAAWSAVGRVLLNLSEFVTKE